MWMRRWAISSSTRDAAIKYHNARVHHEDLPLSAPQAPDPTTTLTTSTLERLYCRTPFLDLEGDLLLGAG